MACDMICSSPPTLEQLQQYSTSIETNHTCAFTILNSMLGGVADAKRDSLSRILLGCWPEVRVKWSVSHYPVLPRS